MIPEYKRLLSWGARVKRFPQGSWTTVLAQRSETLSLFEINAAKQRSFIVAKTFALLAVFIVSAKANAESLVVSNIKVGGYLQYDQNAIFEPAGLSSDLNGELRRARIGVAAKAASNLAVKAEVNIDETGNVDPTSLYVDVTPASLPFALRVGQFNTPNSLDHLTSSRFTSLTERAAFRETFDFKRRVGLAVSSQADRYHWSVAFFGENVNDGAIASGYSTAARVAVTPIHSDQHLLHLGVSARYRRTNEAEGLSYSTSSPFTPDEIALSIGSAGRSDIFTGVEAAYVADRFWLTGEYGVARPFAGGDEITTLSGGYIEAGLSIGGQKSFLNGRFTASQINRSILNGGSGAFFAVIRYDAMRLANSEDSDGFGTIALGIDWVATQHVQLRFNVFDADTGRALSAPPDRTLSESHQNTDNEEFERVRGLKLRLQFIL